MIQFSLPAIIRNKDKEEDKEEEEKEKEEVKEGVEVEEKEFSFHLISLHHRRAISKKIKIKIKGGVLFLK